MEETLVQGYDHIKIHEIGIFQSNLLVLWQQWRLKEQFRESERCKFQNNVYLIKGQIHHYHLHH